MFKRFWWVFLAMIPVGSIVGLLVAGVVTYVMPKKYESEATIEVKPLAGQSGSAQMTPQVFGTEFEKIKSSTSLGKVVLSLELINKWGVDKESAIRILKGIVTTQNIHGTDLISIRVRHTNREDARNITAEIVKTYRNDRLAADGQDGGQALIDLTKSIKDQEGKVSERRDVLLNDQNLLNAKRELETDQALLQSMIQDKSSTREAIEAQEEKVKRRKVLATFVERWIPEDREDAMRSMKTDQALLQSMKLEQINEVISVQRENDIVVIHEEPQIAQTPISPNVSLNLALGTALGFLLSPLLALPVILLLHRLMPVKVTA